MTGWLKINLSLYTLTNGIWLCRTDITRVKTRKLYKLYRAYNYALIWGGRKEDLAEITEEALLPTIQTIR